MFEVFMMALTRPGMLDGYTHDGGKDMVGEGDLSSLLSRANRSILDWRLANSSAPFPEALVRACSGLCSTLARVLELFKHEVHSGTSASSQTASSLARKFDASAPKASSSSSCTGSGWAFCFFFSSAPCTIERSSGFGANLGFS